MASQATDWDNVAGFNPVKQEFIHLDLDRWLKDHGILDEARKQGAQNRPGTDEARGDGLPARIIAWVNRRGRICRDNVSSYLLDLERSLADMEDDDELHVQQQEVRQELGNADLALEQQVGRGRNRLAGPERELREEGMDYREFRRESGLRRLPDDSRRKSALRYLLAFFVIEIVLNASTLMDYMPGGLLAAIVLLGLIGLANVGIFAWFMGNALRYMAHVNPVTKCLSGLAAVLVLPVAASFNLLVGHYRDSTQAFGEDPTADILSVGSDTFDRFAAGWFSFDSFQSALLALLGGLFFAVAAWKWLDRDDRYPDYGRRHRRLEEKRKAYIQEYTEAQDELRPVFDNHQERLKDIRSRLVMKQQRWREHCAQGNKIVADFPTNLRQYQHDLNELLGKYYEANRSARTEPAPAWFADAVEVDAEILQAPSFNPPAQTSLKNVADEVDKAIGSLQETFRSSMRQFPTVQSVLDGDGRETGGANWIGSPKEAGSAVRASDGLEPGGAR